MAEGSIAEFRFDKRFQAKILQAEVAHSNAYPISYKFLSHVIVKMVVGGTAEFRLTYPAPTQVEARLVRAADSHTLIPH